MDKNGDALISPDEAAARRERIFASLTGKGGETGKGGGMGEAGGGDLTLQKFSLPPQPEKVAKVGNHKGFQDLRYTGLQARRKHQFKLMDQNNDGSDEGGIFSSGQEAFRGKRSRQRWVSLRMGIQPPASSILRLLTRAGPLEGLL
jgi:hypothetical protein